MEEGIKNDIFIRGGGGNYFRNVGLFLLFGVDFSEVFDVILYVVVIDKYFIKNVIIYYLFRKLKVFYFNCYIDIVYCSI